MTYELRISDDFNKILQSYRVVILKFYMAGCGPCVRLQREFDQIADHQTLMSQGILIVNINEAMFPGLADAYGVTSFPTVIMKSNNGIFKLQNDANAIINAARFN